ncbi:MAG: S-adenosylmethionine:tRNA ribosyltransferase-isomerase, partial [Blastocatellia bacterium]|nr:S-adenosylmethionine:tRNA ribosyltransferase-isomerase [Blastocatellia bacterium]
MNRYPELTSNIQHLTSVLITEFDYELPPELIAQHPLASRDASRMLVVDRSTGQWKDLDFSSLPSYLGPGD